jgi:hypothetical protein
MSNKQTSVSIPQNLVTKIDTLVGKTRRAAFISNAARGYIIPLVQLLITPVAIFLTWYLGSRSERRRHKMELLEKQFEAFRELRQVSDDIPREPAGDELIVYLKSQPELLNSLKNRILRIFGLRRELVP